MSLPKEPRQKMINLMYLVLTALLALNVSSEILNAFKTVDKSLQVANGIVEGKDKTVLASLQSKLDKAETREKAAIWKPKADQAKAALDQIVAEITSLKKELKEEAGFGKMGKNEKGEEMFKEDDLEAATRLFAAATHGGVGKGKGPVLKQHLEDFKNKLMGIDPEIKTEFEKNLPIDLKVPEGKEWSDHYFHMTPTVAALTILSKFENDVRNSASQVIEFCHKKVGQVDIVFDNYIPLVGTNSNYLMPGEELKINAGIGAYSKAANTTRISVDGAGTTQLPDGTYEWKGTVQGAGPGSKKVHIEFFNQATGKQESKDVEVKYTVGTATGASVSADAVKVMYIGVANPLTISGGSAGAERTKASINNGSLTDKGGGKWEANVTTPGEATVNVSVDGKSAGDFKFRVKRIPDPVAKVGNLEPGRVAANVFRAQGGVVAELKDFIFEGVKYEIQSYTVIGIGGSCFPSLKAAPGNTGKAFQEAARAVVDKSCPGSTVMVDEIKAVGPDGTVRKLPIIAYNLY